MRVEGESLISWEYRPPKHKKIVYSLIPVIVIGGWAVISFLFKRWARNFSGLWTILLIFLISLVMRGFKPQKYALTTQGVYVFDSSKKQWKRLGYWKEFIDYERVVSITGGDEYIKLKKRSVFGAKYIYFNQQDFFKILSIVNENIFTYR